MKLFGQKSLHGLKVNWVAYKAFSYKSRKLCEVWVSAVAQPMNKQSSGEERRSFEIKGGRRAVCKAKCQGWLKNTDGNL